MSTLKDAIRGELQKEKKKTKPASVSNNSTEGLVILSKLNKLFYKRRKIDEIRSGLHASAIITSEKDFCYREQVLSLFFKQNQGENIPEGLMRIFAQGTAIHEKWQDAFVNNGIAVAIEMRSFSEKYDLFFTPDAIVSINGKVYVVEIKSMNTFSYKKVNIHTSGRKQLMLYMHLLGMPRGFVLMEDKNDQSIKLDIVEYDYKMVLPYIERLNMIQEMKKAYKDDGELPARKCKKIGCKRATSCNMRDACWNVGEGRVPLIF